MVTALGDLLELLHGTAPGYRTVQGSIRLWRDRELAGHAARRVHYGGGQGPGPGTRESLLRVWRQGSFRMRIEKSYVVDGEARLSFTVVDGDSWWNYTPEEGAVSSDTDGRSAPDRHDIDRFFDHPTFRHYLEQLELTVLGTAVQAGRRCIRVGGVRRPDGHLWPHWLPYGADGYELAIDAERGVLLSIIGSLAAVPFEVLEVTDVSFDEAIDEEVFRFEPPEGVDVLPARPVTERVSLAEATKRAPFRLFLPDQLSGRDACPTEVMFHPERRHPVRVPPSVTLFFRSGSKSEKLWLTELAAPDDSGGEGETLERSGEVYLLRGQQGGDSLRNLRTERDGTAVHIVSNLPLDTMIDIARALAPL